MWRVLKLVFNAIMSANMAVAQRQTFSYARACGNLISLSAMVIATIGYQRRRNSNCPYTQARDWTKNRRSDLTSITMSLPRPLRGPAHITMLLTTVRRSSWPFVGTRQRTKSVGQAIEAIRTGLVHCWFLYYRGTNIPAKLTVSSLS